MEKHDSHVIVIILDSLITLFKTGNDKNSKIVGKKEN